MELTENEVKRIAHLARLHLTNNETEKYAKDLSKILDLAEQMNQVNTDSIEAMAHPMDLPQRLREDEVTEKNQRELFQSVAPMVENGLYLVPQVIEE